MDRYATGDASAFAELYRQLAPRLRMFLLRLCGSPRLSEDLLQDTFLRIHRARGSFTKGAAAMPWIYAIARNVFLDNVRKGRERSAVAMDELREEPHPLAHSLPTPEAAMVATESLAIVRSTLERMPPAHREAFILIRFEGMSVADAAQVLDASEAAVKVRAFRAYEAFRSALRSAGKDL
jgi:RNA polymerase sigma-70 factor (ECF subfamily)